MICPECGLEITEEVNACPNCAYPIVKLKKKKRFLIPVLISVVLIVFIATPFVYSTVVFNIGQKHQENHKFESAKNCYENVLKIDFWNYQEAQDKLEEVTNNIKMNKLVAKAYIALRNEGFANNPESISNVMSDGLEVSCKIDNIGYIVGNSWNLDVEYTSIYADSTTGLKITKYEAPFQYNGWLTYSTNSILQETSDTKFRTKQIMHTDEGIFEDSYVSYIELYNSKKDLSIFD